MENHGFFKEVSPNPPKGIGANSNKYRNVFLRIGYYSWGFNFPMILTLSPITCDNWVASAVTGSMA